MSSYTSQYTGQQIDSAIGLAHAIGTTAGVPVSSGSNTITALQVRTAVDDSTNLCTSKAVKDAIRDQVGGGGQPPYIGQNGHWYVWNGTTSQWVDSGINAQGQQGQTGPAGEDGYSPSATVSKVGTTATITITDKEGTTTATVSDGSGTPAGGTTGQALRKNSATDYDAGWLDVHEVPAGGSQGHVLKKTSATDYDLEWGTAEGVPSGGTTGQALRKNSATDFDASWLDVHEVPSGGSTNQVLTKQSGTSYALKWATPKSSWAINWTALWTNPSPSSAFEAQTITSFSQTLANYQYVYISARFITSSTEEKAGAMIPINLGSVNKGGCLVGVSSSYMYARGFTVNSANTEVEFTTGFRGTSSGDNYIIPYRIYGGIIK